jgi:hypothetical protein
MKNKIDKLYIFVGVFCIPILTIMILSDSISIIISGEKLKGIPFAIQIFTIIIVSQFLMSLYGIIADSIDEKPLKMYQFRIKNLKEQFQYVHKLTLRQGGLYEKFTKVFNATVYRIFNYLYNKHQRS